MPNKIADLMLSEVLIGTCATPKGEGISVEKNAAATFCMKGRVRK
jgi:hypothetical protein